MNLLALPLVAFLLPAAALRPPPVPKPGPPPPATKAPVPPPMSTSTAGERLPPEERERYALFAQKCSRCHSEQKALEAGFTAEQWDDYLRRKYRRAGAGITERQMREIGAFLRYWSAARR